MIPRALQRRGIAPFGTKWGLLYDLVNQDTPIDASEVADYGLIPIADRQDESFNAFPLQYSS